MFVRVFPQSTGRDPPSMWAAPFYRMRAPKGIKAAGGGHYVAHALSFTLPTPALNWAALFYHMLPTMTFCLTMGPEQEAGDHRPKSLKLLTKINLSSAKLFFFKDFDTATASSSRDVFLLGKQAFTVPTGNSSRVKTPKSSSVHSHESSLSKRTKLVSKK